MRSILITILSALILFLVIPTHGQDIQPKNGKDGGMPVDGGIADGGQTPVQDPIDQEITELDVAPRFVSDPASRRVRMVGLQETREGAEVQETELGYAVEGVMHPRALCNVVLEAQPIDPKVVLGEAGWNKKLPNIPELYNYFKGPKPSWPVMIPGSCNQLDYCYWNTQFRGEMCRTILSLDNYVGSTMAEFLQLPLVDRGRLLKTDGTCEDKEGNKFNCSVPVGDVKAKLGAPIRLLHKWSNRDDLNFVNATWDTDGLGGYKSDRYDRSKFTDTRKIELIRGQ